MRNKCPQKCNYSFNITNAHIRHEHAHTHKHIFIIMRQNDSELRLLKSAFYLNNISYFDFKIRFQKYCKQMVIAVDFVTGYRLLESILGWLDCYGAIQKMLEDVTQFCWITVTGLLLQMHRVVLISCQPHYYSESLRLHTLVFVRIELKVVTK